MPTDEAVCDLTHIRSCPSSPFPSLASCETLVTTFSSVHKYDVGRAFLFYGGVTPAAMRTEGVIKVGSMMEERIFDLIGSADPTQGVPVLFVFVYIFHFILIHKT